MYYRIFHPWEWYYTTSVFVGSRVKEKCSYITLGIIYLWEVE